MEHMHRALISSCSIAPHRFPPSPLLSLFIACCSWLLLTFHFSLLVLYDLLFPTSPPSTPLLSWLLSQFFSSEAPEFPWANETGAAQLLLLLQSSCFLFKHKLIFIQWSSWARLSWLKMGGCIWWRWKKLGRGAIVHDNTNQTGSKHAFIYIWWWWWWFIMGCTQHSLVTSVRDLALVETRCAIYHTTKQPAICLCILLRNTFSRGKTFYLWNKCTTKWLKCSAMLDTALCLLHFGNNEPVFLNCGWENRGPPKDIMGFSGRLDIWEGCKMQTSGNQIY